MKKMKIIVRSESANLWWGIYGFCEKTGWEDLNLFDENKKRIGGLCLNGKGYLRAGLDDLKNDPEETEFVEAIEKYLTDNKCHYWYYYDNKDDEDFYEVPYLAPKNHNGVKPRFMDIWHPDEGIGISTINSAIKVWAKEHLRIEDCDIEIQNEESFEDSLKSFKENEELFGGDSKVEVKFADELIEELSQHWKKPKDEVLKKLENSIK
ncbi:hypothetical protein Fleli_2354 [Bernardetia litoralis DSM 6794]|uniref:Uncharacterized protein n=2 Tax=Bernardetia litoralis TaxID=999 RepID=I4AL91_BERLS|nr:hypothetical protein Fleli_2354 [Bernardetia litoralis DSM 6794]